MSAKIVYQVIIRALDSAHKFASTSKNVAEIIVVILSSLCYVFKVSKVLYKCVVIVHHAVSAPKMHHHRAVVFPVIVGGILSSKLQCNENREFRVIFSPQEQASGTS